MDSKTANLCRQRGMILQHVYLGRENQESRMDHLMLWGLLSNLRVDIGQNGVLTLLQDLKGRGYLVFHSDRNRFSGRTEISQIEITAQGCNLVERLAEDPAVLIP